VPFPSTSSSAAEHHPNDVHIAAASTASSMAPMHATAARHAEGTQAAAAATSSSSSFYGAGAKASPTSILFRPKAPPRPAREPFEDSMNAQLNRDIMAKRSGGDILALCAKQQAEFDMVNLVTAIHRLAKAPDGREFCQHPTTAELTADMCHRMDEFNPQHISNTAWALASLLFSHEPLLAAISAPCLSKV